LRHDKGERALAAAKLIIGLGNPGREYEKTRHNLGFMVVSRLATEYRVTLKKYRHASALAAEISEGDLKALLAEPLTYMNNSGLAVRDIVRFEKLDLADILVVCDDINLAFGEIRLKSAGSDGGHNGLKSIIAELGTESFVRLKLGIGAPPMRDLQVDWVLADFKTAEKKELGDFLDQAVMCCRMWLKGETARAMTEYNQRKGKKNDEQV
jgi:PTH1 family peptidyl-tRNA hydrolase